MYMCCDDMPEKIRQVNTRCRDWLKESNHSCDGTRTFALKVTQRGLGEYVIRCRSCQCHFHEFVISSLEIATWNIPTSMRSNLDSQQRRVLLDESTVIDLVNFYLHQTFHTWQGHSLIEIAHRSNAMNGMNGMYSLRYQPSILHGKYLFGN